MARYLMRPAQYRHRDSAASDILRFRSFLLDIPISNEPPALRPPTLGELLAGLRRLLADLFLSRELLFTKLLMNDTTPLREEIVSPRILQLLSRNPENFSQ